MNLFVVLMEIGLQGDWKREKELAAASAVGYKLLKIFVLQLNHLKDRMCRNGGNYYCIIAYDNRNYLFRAFSQEYPLSVF